MNYTVEEIKVTEKLVEPPVIDYKIFFNFDAEIPFEDAFDIKTERLGSNADKHNLNIKLKKVKGNLDDSYSASGKLSVLEYTSFKTNHTLIGNLKHKTDKTTLARTKMNVWLGVPQSVNTDKACTPRFTLTQFKGTALPERGGKLVVY